MHRICALVALFLALATWPTPAPAALPGRLVVTHDADYSPFAYIDETGNPRGYLVDLWEAFGEANKVRVDFKLGAWEDTLIDMRTGAADIHGGLFVNQERLDYLDYGPTILDLSTDLFVRSSLDSDAAATHPVGVVRADASELFIQEYHPDWNLVRFDTFKGMLEAASHGAIDVFVSDRPVALHFLRQFNAANEFRVQSSLYTLPLRSAVTKGDERTLRFLEHGWANIDEATRTRIHNKWFVTDAHARGWLGSSVLAAACLIVATLLARRLIRKRPV